MSKAPKNVFEWSQEYFRNGDRSLHQTRSTMATLMTYADFHNLTCYPSQRTLAKDTGTDVGTIRRHIRKNVEAGWLDILETGSSYKSNTRYRLSTPGVSERSASVPPVTGDAQPLAPVQQTPITGAGSTPVTDAALTTHVTTHGTNHGSIQENGSRGRDLSDPFRGSESGINASHPTQPSIGTPGTGAGSWISDGSSGAKIVDPFAEMT